MDPVESNAQPSAGVAPLAEPSAAKGPVHHLDELRRFLKESSDVLSFAVVGVFLLLLVGFFYLARIVFLPLVLALMLSFLLQPIVRGLRKLRVPQSLGAGLVLGVGFWVVGHGVTRLQDPALEFAAQVPEAVQKIEGQVRELVRRAERLAGARRRAGQPAPPSVEDTRPPRFDLLNSNLANAFLTHTTAFLTGLIETVVLLYFFLSSGDRFLHKLAQMLPGARDEDEPVRFIHDLQHNISVFLFTITVINACLGALVALGVHLVGMPNAVLWGVAAGLLNFIPYFGPIAGVSVLAVAGLMTFDSVGRALLPPLIYLGLHGLEANLMTPLILGRRLVLNPVVIFLSFMFWTWLWGVPGALLSVPLLMTVRILCDHFKPLNAIGEFLSG